LENPGINVFLEKKLPFLGKLGVPVIVSVASEGDPDEFAMLGEILQKVLQVSAVELKYLLPECQT